MEFYVVDLPYATFGIEVTEGIITRTPPIAKWMKGKTIVEAAKWITDRRGSIYKSNFQEVI